MFEGFVVVVLSEFYTRDEKRFHCPGLYGSEASMLPGTQFLTIW